jgi:5'-3' exonuclease
MFYIRETVRRNYKKKTIKINIFFLWFRFLHSTKKILGFHTASNLKISTQIENLIKQNMTFA